MKKWAKRALVGSLTLGSVGGVGHHLFENSRGFRDTVITTLKTGQDATKMTVLDVAEDVCVSPEEGDPNYYFVSDKMADQHVVRIIKDSLVKINGRRAEFGIDPAEFDPYNLFFCTTREGRIKTGENSEKSNAGGLHMRRGGESFIQLDSRFVRTVIYDPHKQGATERVPNTLAKQAFVGGISAFPKEILLHEMGHIDQNGGIYDWRYEASANDVAGTKPQSLMYKVAGKWWNFLKELAVKKYGSDNIMYEQVYSEDHEIAFDEDFVAGLLEEMDLSDTEKEILVEVLVQMPSSLMLETSALIDEYPEWKERLGLTDSEINRIKEELDTPLFKQRYEKEKAYLRSLKIWKTVSHVSLAVLAVLLVAGAVKVVRRREDEGLTD